MRLVLPRVMQVVTKPLTPEQQKKFHPMRASMIGMGRMRGPGGTMGRGRGARSLPNAVAVDVLPGMNAGASTSAVPSPMEGSGTAWVLLGTWALSPARPTPIHPRPERRGFSALLVSALLWE